MRNSSSLDWLRFMHTPNDYRVSPFNPYGKLVNEVLANYFSISMARNLKVKEQINDAYKALKESDSTTFQKIFEELSKQLGKLDPDIVNLKLESVRKENDEKNK